MNLTDIQSLAITARIAAIVGAQTFDRLFAGVEFSEVDGYILYVYAKDEDCACEIEDSFGLHISIVASELLDREIELVMVLPRQMVA